MINHSVTHRIEGYAGVTVGTTRLKHLFEDPADEEETRVRLSDGTIRVASAVNLVWLDTPDEADAESQLAFDRLTDRGTTGIIDAINEQCIPNAWLVNRSTWQAVCRARGHNLYAVAPEAWREVCRRGYLRYRQNPRGF